VALTPAAYDPDFGVPPGKLLEEYLDERQMSARAFGRRCGRSAKLIVEIIAGKAPIEPETALQFERVLGMSADIWLQMEASYRLHLAKAHELERWSAVTKWADQFPVGEMRKRKVLPPAKTPADTIKQLLNFFGAGSIAACDERFSELADVSYRHSPSFMSSEGPLLVWLRLGEVEAQDIECKDFDRSTFLKSLRKIRTLTNEPYEVANKEMQQYSAAAGVAFVVVKPMPGVALSGISRWLTPRKALIQQSLRHMANDHFWFTFFHEAAHLLLHSRKSVFLDGKNIATGNTKEEKEANEWAANFLVPEDKLHEFIAGFEGTEDEIRSFAREQGISPGIVVGQLQKRSIIHYGKMNHLKQHYEWIEE
jgi:addiction module HigA family antidote